MECDVTIENLQTSSSLTSVKYRRIMDWNIDPTPFNEYVTIFGTQTTNNLVASNNNGWCNSSPLIECSIFNDHDTQNKDFEDYGPYDQGSMFEFNFGTLNAGESITFKIFYGATPVCSIYPYIYPYIYDQISN